MTFDETLEQVLGLLQREKRVSYRALKRRFGLDADYLADLKDEIIEAKQLAVDENAKVLVWTGAGDSDPVQWDNAVRNRAGRSDSYCSADNVQPPAAYTPRHLIDKVLASRSTLEGERSQITVLFCDIADSPRLARQLDASSMHQLLNKVLQLSSEAIHRYQGIVSQYSGDGLVALFGAPLMLEDHAFHAVQAALAIQETIGGYSDAARREYGVTPQLRIGLDSGPVVIGRIGDDLRMDYTTPDDTIHLAACLQTAAAPGTILLSDATHQLVRPYIRSEAAAGFSAKDQQIELSAHKVTGRRRWRRRLEIGAARELTPLTGRRRELTLLRENLAHALDAQSRIIDISAPPGTGKSRLLYELREALGNSVIWISAQCQDYAWNTPFRPWRDILRHQFHIENDDNPLQISQKLRQEITRIDPDLLSVTAFLEALCNLSETGPGQSELTAQEKRQRTFEALRLLIVAGSRSQPVVLVFEDLQWIDNTSQDCLSALIEHEHSAELPLLIITTHHPEYIAPWLHHSRCTALTLEPLNLQKTEEMLTALLGNHALPPPLLPPIWHKCKGNPLFVEEIIHMLRERNLLLEQEDGWYWRGTTELEHVPASLPALIQARIEQLAPPLKRIVQAAAVIGQEFDLALLSRICATDSDPAAALAALQQADLIYKKNNFAEAEYCFKHTITRAAACRSLLPQPLQLLHDAAGRAIEERYSAQPAGQAAMLAHHFGHGNSAGKAAFYALLAGDQAARHGAAGEAAAYYEQALNSARTLTDSNDAHQLQIDACSKLAAMACDAKTFERDRHNLEYACTLAADLQDKQRLAEVLYQLGRVHSLQGDTLAALKFAERSLAIADQLGDEMLAAPAVSLAGSMLWLQSDYQYTARMLIRSAGQMRLNGNPAQEAAATALAARAYAFLGDAVQAQTLIEFSLKLVCGLDNPAIEAMVFMCRAALYDQCGEWSQALADYAEAGRLAEQAGDLAGVYLTYCQQGRAHAMNADPQHGSEILEQALTIAIRRNINLVPAWPRAHLADCLVKLQQYDKAEPLCREAIRLAISSGDHYGQFSAQRTLAATLTYLHPQQPAAIHAAMHEAIRLQRQLGAQPELARSYIAYSRLLNVLGETEDAAEYLNQATGLCEQLHMSADLAEAIELLPANQLVS